MRLVVGLGNPGKKYEDTRHNTGFRVLENLKSKIKKGDAKQKSKIVLFKPPTFMNLSGQEVLKKLNYLHLKPEDLIVIYDDIDLPFGEVRVRHKGRSAGHKGVQSIIDALGTENFTRVRIGIGRPPQGKSAEEYVLEEFSQDEEKNLPKIIDEAVEKVIELIKK
jgi:PTH1 family peptidyl-tRNA hydrolase